MKTVAAVRRTIHESARPDFLGPCALGVPGVRLRRLAGLLAILAAAVVLPGQTAAQSAFRVTPHVGGWLPLGPVQQRLDSGALVSLSQVGDILVGARAGWSLAKAYAVELTLAGSPGQVARTDIFGTRDIPALAMLTSARITRLGKLNDEFDGHFGAGIGVIRRSGRGWDGTHWTPTVLGGFGLQTELARKTAFKVEIELHASRGRRTGTLPQSTTRAWRADVVVSFGVVFPAITRGRVREAQER
jgi:hypothetical protein